jgi:ketosteroid isomerase-like protein
MGIIHGERGSHDSNRAFTFPAETVRAANKSWTRRLVFCLLLSGIAFAQSTDVEALNQQWAEALVHADASVLDRILGDHLTYTHTDGQTETKSQFMESLHSGQIKYESLEFEDSIVHVYGNVAVISSHVRVKLTTGGQQVSLHAVFLNVYAREKDRWQMIAHQATRLSEP